MKYLLGAMALATLTLVAAEIDLEIDPATVDPNTGPFLLNGTYERQGDASASVQLEEVESFPVKVSCEATLARRFKSTPPEGLQIIVR